MEFYFNHINALRVEPRIEKLLSLASATPSSLALMKGHSRLHLVETPAAQLHAGETWSCGELLQIVFTSCSHLLSLGGNKLAVGSFCSSC